MRNSWKRIAAGAMSLAMVAGAMPANVGGLLTGGNGIVAYAADVTATSTGKNTIINYGDRITRNNNNTWTIARPSQSSITLNNYAWTADDDYVVFSRSGNNNRTINLRKLISGSNTSIDIATFNGNGLTPTVKRTINGVTTTLTSNDYTIDEIRNGAGEVVTEVKDAGTYTVKINGAGNYSTAFTGTGNDNGQSGVELTWTVAKADIDYTAPTAKTLTYTGEEQELVNAGSVTNNAGTIQFLLEGTTEWSDFVPKATDAGDYTVYYKIDGDDNYKDVTAKSVNVSIARKGINDSTITIDAIENQDYTGSAITPEPVVKDGTKTLIEDTDYTVSYSTNNTNPGTATITIAGIGNYTGTTNVNFAIDYATVGLRLNNLDGAVLATTNNVPLNANADGVYSVKGHQTYYLYSDSAVPTEGIVDSQATDKKLGDVTYEYRYTIEIPDIPESNGYMISHTNNWKGKVPEDHKELLYVYEDNEEDKADIGAILAPAETYYYGDTPAKSVVDIQDGFGNIVTVDEVFFSDASGAKVVNPSAGGASSVTANVFVNKSGSLEEGEKKDYLVMRKDIDYVARPLSLCDIYLVNGETEIKLPVDIENGVATVPADAFIYDSEEKAPVIVVKNPGNGEIVEAYDIVEGGATSGIDAGDYSFDLNADADTTDNYSGTLTVNWKISKAEIKGLTADFNGKIYDGNALNSDDFTFTNEQPNLLGNEKTVITVTDANNGDIVNAGTYAAKVKISNPNYIDKVVTVEDSEIEKRKVIVTPNEDQSITFGESAPQIYFGVDIALDIDNDGVYDSDDGIVPTDLEVNQPAVTFLGDAVKIDKEISTTNNLKPGANDAFDYEYYVNDAGTYSYTLNADVIAAKTNYELILADGEVFTINKKPLTEDLFNVEDPAYIYDGNAKGAPRYSIAEQPFANGVDKLTDSADNFVLGGTSKAVLPGQYTLEFDADDVANSNYSGWISYDWTIKSSKKYTAQVTAEDYIFGKKTADESVSTVIYRTGDDTYSPIEISGAKTTYTYYKYDGQSDITPAYIATLTPIDISPVNVGRYIVAAHTTARGYEFDDTYDTFTIRTELTDANITVTGISLIGEDGWAHPNDSIKVEAVVNGVGTVLIPGVDYDTITASRTKNTGSFSVQIEGKGLFCGLAEASVDVISDFSKVIDLKGNVPGVSINPANKGLYVKLGFEGTILDSNYTVAEYGLIYNNNGTISDASQLRIENVDDESIVLLANKNGINVRDYGKGVVAVGYVKLVSQSGEAVYAYTDNIGGDTYVCTESKPTGVINPANNTEHVKVLFTGNIYKEGYSVTEYGLIYNNTGEVSDASELTLEAVDNTTIIQAVNKNGLNIRDNGNGVVAVGYMKVENSAGQEAIIYTNDLGGKYSELAQ